VNARIEVLGVPVDVLDVDGLLDGVEALIDRGGARARTVAYLNVHVANTAASDPALHAFLSGVDLCYCDGAGVVLGARLLGHELPGRMTGADWIWKLAARSEGRRRIFWLGGEPGVSEAACNALRERHPGLELDADHGFHGEAEVPALLERIQAFGPDILLVGMGTPVQERWVQRWLGGLQAVPVVWVLGATADFLSGKVDRGPAWLHDRQEWLARLVTEPGRLWKRYLVGNPLFLARVLKQRLRG